MPKFPTAEEALRAAQSEMRRGAVASEPQSASGAGAPHSAVPTEILQNPASTPAPLAGTAAMAAQADPAGRRLMQLLAQYGVDQSLALPLLRGRLYVAVSFSMPEEALRRLVYQATAAGGIVVLRGFDGTPSKTRERITRIVGDAKVPDPRAAGAPASLVSLPRALEKMSVRVAPRLFDRFEIREVPAFVLVPPAGANDDCRDRTCPGYKDFTVVQGDVTVAYALDAMARMRPSLGPAAEYFARRAGAAPSNGKEKR